MDTEMTKTERIVIKCTPETKKEWRMLAARLGLSYEQLLIRLIRKANYEWFPEKLY
jgi:hypothetical protein